MSGVVVAGTGMHPWGKWGHDFTTYGVSAARTALEDASLDWSQVDLLVGADTIRNGYPGFVAATTMARALGWSGARAASCASGAQALDTARARILAGLCDVALVIGADHNPEGVLSPGRRRSTRRPGLAPLPIDGTHQSCVLRPVRPKMAPRSSSSSGVGDRVSVTSTGARTRWPWRPCRR